MTRPLFILRAVERPLAALLGPAVLALFLAGCDAAGRAGDGQPELADGRPTLVSLNPCIDAILVEIAPRSQVLALSHYSRDPVASSIPPGTAAHYAITGGTAEEVIALGPDMVLASSFLDPATSRALDRAGIAVAGFGAPATVDQSREQVAEIGRLTGNRESAEQLSAQLDAAPSPPVMAADRPSVLLWQLGEIVAGENTLIAQLLDEAGFASHAAALGLAQADRASLEQVLAHPPDLLLVAGTSAGQTHPALRQAEGLTLAAFDPKLFYCGGPSIIAARAALADIRAQLEPAP